MESNRTLLTDRGDAGQRLDRVLRRHLTDVTTSRTRIQRWIEDGHVAVNGTVIRRAAARAARGDVLSVAIPAVPDPAITAADSASSTEQLVALVVLYEDDHLLIVDKPAGVVAHPTYRHPGGTLLNALRSHARDWPDSQRPSLVGRLDKLTSGLVIVAKTPAVHAALQRTATSTKDYLAMVYGRVKPGAGHIDLRLRRDPADRRRVIASSSIGSIGSPSLTRFERLASVAAPRVGLTLLRCSLVTGRMHQIRAHLAARGWPLVGDPVYGGPVWTRIADATLAAALKSFPRQALHAWRVEFPHPVTRRPVAIEAPLPTDLQTLLGTAALA